MTRLLYWAAFLGLCGVGAGVPWEACAAAECLLSPSVVTQVFDRKWRQIGAAPTRVVLPSASRRDLLLETIETGVDVEVEVLDVNGKIISRTDNPVDRAASQMTSLPSSGPVPVVVLVSGKAPAARGEVQLRLFALTPETSPAPHTSSGTNGCRSALRYRAQADSDYAQGRAIEIGQPVSGSRPGAHELFESAATGYRSALEQLSTAGSAAERGALQLALAALFYYERQDWTGSAAWASAAAASFAAANDEYMRARAQAILAAAWLETATQSQSTTLAAGTPRDSAARLERARRILRRLVLFHAARHELYEQALQINNIGLAYYYEARFERALPYFTQAQRLFERLGESSRLAVALQNLALCEWGLGRLSAALPVFDKALALLSPVPSPNLYLVTLNNSGLAHYAAGQFDRALELQTTALDFATRSQADRARARSFYGMGVTYYAIGDRTLAAEFLREALTIDTAQLDARIHVAALRALALIEHENGDQSNAIAHNSEALRLATAPSARARILLQLALDYEARGDRTPALQLLAGIIEHPPQGDALVRAMALVQRGAVRRASGQLAAAAGDLTTGLTIFAHFDSIDERFEAEVELARVRADQGHTDSALAAVQRALLLAPEIRAQTANPEYRASIGESLRPALELELDLLRARYEELTRQGQERIAKGTAARALLAVDQLRANSFDEWHSERLQDPRVAPVLAASTSLYRELAERRFQLATRDDHAGPADRRAQILREEITQLRARLGVINAELAKRTIRQSTGSSAQLRSDGVPHQADIAPGTAIVSYWVGSDRAYAWVVRRNDLAWVRLPPSTVIERSARRLNEAMRSLATVPASMRLSASAELYGLIVAPAAQYLASAQTLILVPDGSLHYVPFAALYPGGVEPFLVQRLVILVAPAVRFLLRAPAIQPAPPTAPETRRTLIVADPVYEADDPRLHTLASAPTRIAPPVGQEMRGTTNLIRLPSTAREARQIGALFAAGQVDSLTGLDATRENLVGRDLSGYRFIHIASHGLIDAEIPQLSALILGTYGPGGPVQDPYFRASDFLARTFNADAIVLSACETALGAESPSEGLIGLRYAALARGAHSVVASLWPVSDGIAADLMTDMYREMTAVPIEADKKQQVGIGEAVARSLTAATRRLLHRTPQLDPALWAPFAVYVAGN